jgi:hypothetical protein
MSWHTSLLSIERMSIAQFLEQCLDFHLTDHYYADGWEGTERIDDQFSIAQVGSWLVIADPLFVFFETEYLVRPLSRGRRALTILMEGASCTHGFQLFENEELKRAFVFVGALDDSVVVNEGERLPEEHGVDIFHPWYEENMFRIWEHITGMSFEALMQPTYQGLMSDKFDEYN